MARRRVTTSLVEKSKTKKTIKKKKLSSDLLTQQHAELVKCLCDDLYFRRLVFRLNKKNKNSSLSKVLIDASTHILNGDAHMPSRRIFSQSQKAQLEAEFGYTRYINNMRCKTLASELSIDELAIQRWFQRRRLKEKRRLVPVLPLIQYIPPMDILPAIAG